MSVICAIPVLSAFFAACTGTPPLATGYVEGEYRLIAPITTAQVAELSVRRGDRVERGQTLAVMEMRDAKIALSEAEAALAQAESRLADLRRGRRKEEIAVIEASLASARAQAAEAEKEEERQRALLERGAAPETKLDDARTRLDVARAQVAQAEADLAVAKLPARPDEIEAAKAAVAQAKAKTDAAQWQMDQRTLTAPADGEIFDTLRTAGEIAGPQAPVLSMLPDGAVLVRIFVPEAAISAISTGSILDVRCDGCPPDTTATVTYVSDSPEFTPPVIYSLENRQKLVYMVEARPDAGVTVLQPGQIVDVTLEPAP